MGRTARHGLTLSTSLSVREVAAEVATGEVVEDAVARLSSEDCFVYLRRIEQMSELLGKWKRTLEARMSAEGMVGQKWMDEGHTFAFLRSSRGDFADPRALFADLMALGGMDALEIADAVSKVRVTTLREKAAQITDEDRKALVLDLIEEHRVRVEGAPRLVDLDEPHRKAAIAAKKKENT